MTDTYRKPTLDKDLDKIATMEEATGLLNRGFVTPGLALVFIFLCAVIAAVFVTGHPGAVTIIAAAAIGAYMALNIGANDVANNVGPAVGSQAMTMGVALAIAAVFESAGALIAGGDVVSTISKGIIDPVAVSDPDIFIAAMMASLVAAAMWLHLATFIGAPVSTTHSIVGGVMGAGIAAAGVDAVNWQTMGGIAASWVISPLMGGVVAALFLAFIKTAIIYQDDKIAAARRWVPVLIAIMAGAFAAYLSLKGLKTLVEVSPGQALMVGAAVTIVTWAVTRPVIERQARGLENRNQSLRKLFGIPLICSAALLSFAHGANDVANAVGPLAAIVHTAEYGDVAAQVTIPLWVMAVGAAGISLGLVLFGPKLIRMVGNQITKLNPMRAYCVALSAAITVIVASALGLPVSSTHIAVGAVFGVGFFREWYTESSGRRADYVTRHKINPSDNKAAKGRLAEQRRRKLVRRSHFLQIIAAWVVTVPAAAVLSGFWFVVLRAVLY
ncbi:MAG: inorganic phosphate transporter [Hoeflea sp.]|uniref:inorganic phosphate transporter n=1 Tax=Hoeflea sp. TaxID=1940281 RepID=UPI001D33874A|nr:inorganic phosphate transporter [Hoeflea sp.]MBU4530919.1 inorganic phosphate transporter [Alphaproteobacteria bacterium]MBU4542694.1 inorganic phosphate transporter [Alphaproteobacteria bacterium]MBU4549379.1 inorganic phosphate transporter [Alphaproteobacteria bacterium]MBV1722811.1 inorganic phosphate transporter [Hoeflea sp.]MBV1761533.1 inorganic phosphate transporter [Hoeflea sp.]